MHLMEALVRDILCRLLIGNRLLGNELGLGLRLRIPLLLLLLKGLLARLLVSVLRVCLGLCCLPVDGRREGGSLGVWLLLVRNG